MFTNVGLHYTYAVIGMGGVVFMSPHFGTAEIMKRLDRNCAMISQILTSN